MKHRTTECYVLEGTCKGHLVQPNILHLRCSKTLPSHLHHKSEIRGASKVEMQPAPGWAGFCPVTLCSHGQWGPTRAWARAWALLCSVLMFPHLERACSSQPASQGTGSVSWPSLTLNTSCRHWLEAFMLTALGDMKTDIHTIKN